jgi:hypothetical protein
VFRSERTSAVIHRDTSCRELRRIPLTPLERVSTSPHVSFPLSHSVFLAAPHLYIAKPSAVTTTTNTHTGLPCFTSSTTHNSSDSVTGCLQKKNTQLHHHHGVLFPRRLMNSTSPPHHRVLCMGAASPRVSMARTCSSGLAPTHTPSPPYMECQSCFFFLFVHTVQENIRSYANHTRELPSRYFLPPALNMQWNESTVSFLPQACGCAGPRGNTVS